MAAEDTAVHVRLVQYHVAQLMQELGPAFVARQDADVKHVRVAEEDGRRASQERPLVLRGVPVVDGRDDAGHVEPVELACLVLGERLGGEEEEGARLRVGGEGLEGGQLVAEALAARRPRADDDVVAGRQQVARGGLMTVKRMNAGREECFAQRGRQIVGKVGGAAAPRRLVRHGHDLLVPAAGEERLQRPCSLGGHAGVVIHAVILLREPAVGGSGTQIPAARRGPPAA